MISKRIYMFLSICLILIILLSNISLYFIFHKVAINNELEQLRSKSEQVANALMESEIIDVNELLILSVPIKGMVRIIDENQNSISSIVTSENANLNDKTLTFKEIETSEIKTIDGVQYAVTYDPIIWSDGNVVTLELVKSLEPLQKNIAILKPILTGISLILIISIIPFLVLGKRRYK